MFLALVVGFDGDRPATGVRAHPFDADGAATGADVPEQLAGAGRQVRQGHGADVALGQLAVVAIGFVGQARGQRQAHGAGAGAAFHRHQVEIGGARQRPVAGEAVETALERPAEVFQHAQATGAEATGVQQAGDGGRAVAVVAEDQQAPAVVDLCLQRCQRARHQRQAGDLLQGPAEAGGGQREGGGRRQDPQFGRRQLPGETGADAEQHRVAAGQHAGRLAAPGQQWFQGERRRPGFAGGADARRQQFQLARRADDPAGLQQGTPGLLAEAGITVLADAHQGQPGRRRVCR